MFRLLRNIILTVLVLVLLALGGLATPPGRAIVAGMIERAASANGLTVTIGSLSGWPPFRLGADRITIADGDGVFAEIDSADVDVRMLALITGQIAFDSITAERVAIARQPNLPGGGGEGALLPFAAEKVSVARLELGAELAGRPAVLTLNGSLISGGNGSIAATVNAERIDGITGTLAATVDRADAGAPLVVDLNLTEADNGILVGLMGRPDGPGYTLAAHTGFNGDALEGDLSLTSDGAARFDGRFTLSPAGAGHRLILNGAGDLAELVPPGYEALLSGAIDVAIDADWAIVEGDPLPQITVRQGTVNTASVRASASGALTPEVADLAVTINAAQPDGGRIAVPGLAVPAWLDTVVLTGKVVPSGDAIRLEVVGQIGGLAAGDTSAPNLGVSLALEAQQDDPLAGGALPFALRLEADALDTPAGRIAAQAGAPLVLSADGTYDTETQSAETTADLAAAGGIATFTGTLAAIGADGQLHIRFDDLTPLSAFAGRSLAGAIDATADGHFGSDTDARLTATSTNLDPGDPTLKRILAGTTTWAGAVRRGADGAIAISDLAINGSAFNATGNVALTADTIDGTLAGAVDDLALLADASSGAATFTARVSGATVRPDVDATIAVASGRLLDQAVDNATVNFKGAPNDSGWSGTLSLSGGFAGGPLAGTATAVIDRTSNQLSFPDVNLSIGDNRITGAIERTGAGPLSGSLSIDAPNLRTLAALALVDATGSAQADVRLAPDGDKQSLTVAFVGSDVAYGTAASARRLRGEVQIDDAFGVPQVRGNATGSMVTVGTMLLDSAQATATVEDGATLFKAEARGADINLAGSGRYSGSAGNQTLRIDALNGTAYRFPVALNQPVTLNFAGGASRIDGATLTLGGGTVRIDGTVAPTLDLTIAADRVAASVADSFSAGLGAQGTITGRARVTGSTAAPNFTWQANWTGLSTTATRDARLPGLSLSATGTGTRTKTSVDARLTGAGLTLAITGDVPFAGSGLNIRAQGTAPLALLATESARELRLAGTARLNLTVTGAAALPRIAGTIDLAEATFADTDSGFGVTGANGRLTFDGDRATIQTLTGRLLQGGDVTVTGTIGTGAGLPANLAIRIANGRYNDGRMINTSFNANLTIAGPITGAGTLAGTVALGRTEIQLPDRIGSSQSTVEVTHINAPPGFVPPQPRYSPRGGAGAPRSSGGGGGLNLDVTMTGTSGIFVRGFGIDAELGGQLRLAGTTGNPQAIGGFQMVRGRIEAIGRRFDFTRGQLTFAGDLVPVLDFAATTTTSGATVTLLVTGPADDPHIVFTSSPEMPQEEILSRLLFNQSVGRLTPFQAVQLVDAFAQLTGAVGAGGIVARIRQATGLDDLDIRQSATGGTVVGIGRRINERLRLGVEAGTDSASGRVVIDLDITKNLKAQAEAGQDGSGKVGLTYEREY